MVSELFTDGSGLTPRLAIWVDLRREAGDNGAWSDHEALLERADSVLVDQDFSPNGTVLERVRRLRVGEGDSCGHFDGASDEPLAAVPLLRISDAPSLVAAVEACEAHPVVLVSLTDETNIPLELVLAKAQPFGTRVIKLIRDAEDGVISSSVMESGVAGVAIRHPGHLVQLLQHLDRLSAREPFELQSIDVGRVGHIGHGFRACIDTVELLGEQEGMVVGSTSAGGLLVCPEVYPMPYMDLRPFRVNAGAIHSYVWAPEGKTRYVSELRAGESVAVTSVDGVSRAVVIGRIKIEVRPLRLIEGESPRGPVNIIVQDDWHVRVFDDAGAPRNVSSVAPGDRLLYHPGTHARHVGLPIDEFIVEV